MVMNNDGFVWICGKTSLSTTWPASAFFGSTRKNHQIHVKHKLAFWFSPIVALIKSSCNADPIFPVEQTQTILWVVYPILRYNYKPPPVITIFMGFKPSQMVKMALF
jgi:hypothetical protein